MAELAKSGGHINGFLPTPDVELMSTHLFSSVDQTGTQNMVKDWDAKITLGNMENQLAKYSGSWSPCAVEYLEYMKVLF